MHECVSAWRHAGPHSTFYYLHAAPELLGLAAQRLHTHQAGGLRRAPAREGNSIATRNARLTAIHSLFRYASLQAPEHAGLIARVLSIPAKRTHTSIVSFLTKAELDALIGAPCTATWHGRRDRALLMLTAQTGLRVSELTGLTIGDVHLGTGPHVSCRGKNRKSRCTPLTPPAAQALAPWLEERGRRDSDAAALRGHGPAARRH